MSELRNSAPGRDVASSRVQQIARLHNTELCRDPSWEGSLEEYSEIVWRRADVTRTAPRRLYDMVMSCGTEEYVDNEKKLIRYNLFPVDRDGGRDAIFGLDIC